MKGTILDFNIATNEGVISAQDGARYSFTNSDWRSASLHPTQGMEVDFSTQESSAKEVYGFAPVEQTPTAASDLNAWQHYVAAFKQYATFSGRTSLAGFWYFQLISFVISFALSIISAGLLGLLYTLGVLIPSLAIGARRLHDTGKSGWWQLLLFIPLIGLIVLIILWAQAPQAQKNQYDID